MNWRLLIDLCVRIPACYRKQSIMSPVLWPVLLGTPSVFAMTLSCVIDYGSWTDWLMSEGHFFACRLAQFLQCAVNNSSSKEWWDMESSHCPTLSPSLDQLEPRFQVKTFPVKKKNLLGRQVAFLTKGGHVWWEFIGDLCDVCLRHSLKVSARV